MVGFSPDPVERENCCDDLAVATTGDSREYVRALLVLEEIRSPRQIAPGPAVAADGGSLWRRAARLLPASSPAEDAPRWIAGVLALAMAATVAAAARAPFFGDDPVHMAAPAVAPATAVAAMAAVKPVAATPALPPREAAAVTPVSQAALASAAAGGVAGGVTDGVAGGVEGGIEEGIAGGVEEGEGGESDDADDEKPAPREKDAPLSPEELSSLRSHGVTPEFLAALATLDYKQVSVSGLIALKTHG